MAISHRIVTEESFSVAGWLLRGKSLEQNIIDFSMGDRSI
ncbi:hypothetical protein B6N60_03279 [Richelia sinica FACHB-800]|uniref:Uncharacterized protein n=1 Tax=Richelia sinica FACHB-800 TaxID=1357546 RepID=A0A975T9H6_9NOST|nr:hypothetical protein B6N60_03279 [Richelia sinica FACHB-800]